MSPDVVVLLTVLAAITVTAAIVVVDKIMKAAGFEGGPPYRKKLNHKKLYRQLHKAMRPLEDAVRRLRLLERLQNVDLAAQATDGVDVEEVVGSRFLEMVKSVDLPYVPLLLWKKKWTRSKSLWSRTSFDRGETEIAVFALKPGASTALRIAWGLHLQIIQSEIVRQEALCRELQSEVTAICTDLGIEPIIVFSEEKSETKAEPVPETKREELQKLRLRVAELEEEVLAEQGGEGPLRRPAGIPRDN